MGEFRERSTGEVKSQDEWRKQFPNMSIPKVWKPATLDTLNLDPVLPGAAAATGQYQVSLRDGVEQNANGDWVEKYRTADMFSDYTDEDGVSHTKADQEAAYQAALDAQVATSNRIIRNKYLDDSDWTQMNDSPLSNEDKTAWATYRNELRNLPDDDAWPNLSDEDWPVKP